MIYLSYLMLASNCLADREIRTFFSDDEVIFLDLKD